MDKFNLYDSLIDLSPIKDYCRANGRIFKCKEGIFEAYDAL